MRAPTYIVTAATPAGSVCFRDKIEAYSEHGAIEKAQNRDDGQLAQRTWPGARWVAVPKSKGL